MKSLLGERLHFDWKVVTITIVSTLLLIVDSYHPLTPHKYWDRVILYLIIPLLIIILMPLTFTITIGIGAGMVVWVLLQVVSGRATQVHWLMWLVFLAFVLFFAQTWVTTMLAG